MAISQDYDIIIIGGGPAGLTAAIYAARARRKTLVIEKATPGGQVITTELLENFPGFPDGISGNELGLRMEDQAKKFGAEVISAEVAALEIADPWRIVKTTDGTYYRALAVVIATGSTPLLTGVPGETEFLGRGVSTCATCDAFFYRNKDVVVIGGGDAAVEEAIFLTKFARQVYIIHRRDSLRAQKILQERALANPRINFVWNSVLVSINGKEKVQSVTVKNVITQQTSDINCEGVFIYIGRKTNTEFLQGIVPLDEKGAVVVNLRMETSIPGIFAAGEVRSQSCRQAIASAGDGACAAISADHYLQQLKPF